MSARQHFVLTLSPLAAIYGGILAYRLIGFQSDGISDALKMSVMIFGLALIISYVWWSVVTTKLRGKKSGALAGALTAITLIPLPTFIGAFKSHVTANNHDVINAALEAAQYSLSTFSLAEAISIPLSVCVGIWAARDE